MRFIDQLYTVDGHTIVDDTTSQYMITLNSGHPVYKAHFPGHPVTPGVVELQIVSELLALHMGRRLHPREYVNVKYLAVLSPVEVPEVSVLITAMQLPDASTKVSAAITSGDTTFVKLSAVYE